MINRLAPVDSQPAESDRMIIDQQQTIHEAPTPSHLISFPRGHPALDLSLLEDTAGLASSSSSTTTSLTSSSSSSAVVAASSALHGSTSSKSKKRTRQHELLQPLQREHETQQSDLPDQFQSTLSSSSSTCVSAAEVSTIPSDDLESHGRASMSGLVFQLFSSFSILFCHSIFLYLSLLFIFF